MTDDARAEPTITTNVGWSGPGENYFRGYSVPDALVGRHGYWTLLSLSAGHRPLEPDEARFLDALSTAMNASDPRIPPLKFAWVAGSLGGSLNTVGALLVWLDGSQVGPSPAHEAARAWLALAELGDAEDAIGRWFDEHKARGERVAGFGVPGRDRDERVEAAQAIIAAHGREHGRFVRLFARVEAVLMARGRVRPNIVGLMTACALDLGFEPHHMPLVVWPGLEVSILANAIDAAKQRPEVLHRLPTRWIRYDGPAPRASPRAQGEDR